MKTTKLAVLTAAILFAFSFTFSSCKCCNKGKIRSQKTTEAEKKVEEMVKTVRYAIKDEINKRVEIKWKWKNEWLEGWWEEMETLIVAVVREEMKKVTATEWSIVEVGDVERQIRDEVVGAVVRAVLEAVVGAEKDAKNTEEARRMGKLEGTREEVKKVIKTKIGEVLSSMYSTE
jgi:hypothetical protein